MAIYANSASADRANLAAARSLLQARRMLTDRFGTGAITRDVVGCAIRAHEVIGPGVFEAITGAAT
jgi:hypothetical protein